MPVMRAFGGGTLMIEAAGYTRRLLTPDAWCGIDLLLKQQDYVQDVVPWTKGMFCHYNLNDFRARLFQAVRKGQGKDKHLGHWMCDAHGIPYGAMNQAWLKVEPNPVAKVVISRAGAGRGSHHVYQNHLFPWHLVWRKYGKDAVFVGTEHEHTAFTHACGEVPHYPTANLLEAAQVIAGGQLFIGNQSAPHAIAEGLKKNIVLEVWPEGPNCLMFRPGVHHGWDHRVALPDL
jgi:hypothetical protein